jgi:hypothetical protein
MMSSQMLRNTSPALERTAASMHGRIGQGGRGCVFIFAPSEKVEGVPVSETFPCSLGSFRGAGLLQVVQVVHLPWWDGPWRVSVLMWGAGEAIKATFKQSGVCNLVWMQVSMASVIKYRRFVLISIYVIFHLLSTFTWRHL